MMAGGFTTYRIKLVQDLNPQTKWIELDAPLSGEPGQFVMLWLPGIGEKPYSIAGFDPFRLLVVDVGPFSHAVHELSEGDSLWVKGPLGCGFSIQGTRLLLAGGGYGAAPLLALAQNACEQRYEVTVCLGARGMEALLLVDAFERLGCGLVLTTEDGSCGEQGLITSPISRLTASRSFDTLYACGPGAMLSALAAICNENRLDYQLSWEAKMRCGMGLCGSCEVFQSQDANLPPGWLACFDGPVFRHTWKG